MRISAIALVILSLVGTSFGAENWPRFRGPHGDGRADSAKPPLKWSESQNIVWKTPIHDKGWSSPVVWGEQVWVTTAKADGTQLFAVCVDRTSGKIVHDLKIFDVDKPSTLWPKFNSFASPTPVIEEGRIYVHFGTYGTACLDTKSGKTLWKNEELHCDHWRGAASSPILYGDLLYLQFDGYDAQFVAALDKTTGRTIWKKDRAIDYKTTNGDLKKAFGTPKIIVVAGKPQLISPAAVATESFDPKTGEELWKVYHGGMNVSATPLYGLGKLFLCTGDGPANLLAVRPDGKGDVTATHIDWKSNKNVPSRSSPLLLGDLLYMVNNGGRVFCVEAKTGEPIWQEPLGGSYFASPICANDRLYFFDEGGKSHVFSTGRQAKRLATNKLDDGCRASPAVSGKSLFVRTLTHLYRIESRE